MHTGNPRLPFPPNPAFGKGSARRRIVLTRDGRTVVATLSDIFHEMSCLIEHDGVRVVDISAETVRIPNTSCPGAVTMLREFVGMPLLTARTGGAERARRHCTHLLDLALLAIAHALREETERIYEAVVPDETSDPVWIEVCRNGTSVLKWLVKDGRLIQPSQLAGRPVLSGFSSWAATTFDAEDLEAATVLARTYLIASGRAYLTEAWAGQPIARNGGLAGACYSYAPERIAEGVFLAGNVRDFSSGIP